jgi:hypothetical protein
MLFGEIVMRERIAIGLAASVLILAGGEARGEKVTWRTEDGGNGHQYEAILVPGGIGWNQAQEAAQDRGGYLASIGSAAENNFVFNLIQDISYWFVLVGSPTRYFGPWIGGHQPIGETVANANWSWESGEPWDYTNWLPGQPDHFNGRPENYLHYFGRDTTGGRTPTWNDATDPPNGGSVVAYVVEYAPEPGAVGVIAAGAVVCWRRRRR